MLAAGLETFVLMELERVSATWLVAENMARTPFWSRPRLKSCLKPIITSFFAMNRRKMKRPLNALIRSKMKKKRWCWNFDDHRLRHEETKNNNRKLLTLLCAMKPFKTSRSQGVPLKDSNCKLEIKIICINLKENLMKKRKVTIKSRCLCGRRLWLTLTMKSAKIITYMTVSIKLSRRLSEAKITVQSLEERVDQTHEFALFSAQKP